MWETIWPYLATTGVTIGAASFVQLWIVPRVETRKRREDRWEQDVRALGELVAFTLAEAHIEMVTAIHLEVLISARNSDMDPSRLLQVRTEQEIRMQQAQGQYREAASKVEWLTNRVVGPDRSGSLDRLRGAHGRFLIGLMEVVRLGNGDQLMPAEAETAVARLEEGRKAITDEVERLADKPPPRMGRSIRRAAS